MVVSKKQPRAAAVPRSNILIGKLVVPRLELTPLERWEKATLRSADYLVALE